MTWLQLILLILVLIFGFGYLSAKITAKMGEEMEQHRITVELGLRAIRESLDRRNAEIRK